MKKRLLTVLLAVLMIVSLLPSMVFASEVGCTRTQKVTTITDGETYQMNLSGKNKGDFTFEASGKNWNIKNSDGRYLNAADGKLVLEGAAETAWTYSKGAFSISEKTTQKNNGYWWGWMWIPGWGSKTVTTTYYLSTVTNGAKLSTSCVSAELYKTVSGDHDYDKAVYVDKTNHKYVCRYCGDVKTEAHSYDGTTHKCVCGAYDPAESSVKISVDVKEKTTKQYIGWWPWGYYKTITTYTAAIKTDAKGVKVTKVQYQMNGGKWTTGTCVTSEKPIESLKVKAWDNNGNLYEYEWPEEVEKQTALYTYVYENKEPYDYIKDATVTFVTGEAESRTFTGETDAYGFAAINVPRNVEGTLTISKDGYVTKTKENVTYNEATAEEKFWLDIAKSEIKITLAVSGEGAGHFEDVWAPGVVVTSVEFESGKYFSDNENGYFYIADDASGTGVHPYQFVADEGSGFAGFDPNKATYEAITTGFTLTANAEKMQTVTFHAGTADEIAKGAMITGAAGKWNVAADSRSAYRSYRTSELDEGAIKAEGSASVEAVYEGYSVTSWTKAASTWDYYPAWKANSYNVNAQVQGDHGTATVKVNDVEVSSAAYASNVVFSATPNAGYEFDHWEVVSGGIDIESSKTNNPISLTMPSTALTLKAHFKAAVPATYNIIVEDDGHGTASANPTSAAPGATVTLTATPSTGYAFKEWQIGRGLEAGAITDDSFTMPSNEVKVKALFEKEYTVEVEAGGHGSVSANVEKGVSGTEVNLTLTPDAGYEKDQITVVRGGVTVVDNKFNIGTADVKIRVTFKVIVPDTYGIIVEDDGHGTASADPTSAAPGTSIALTATPSTGYAFKEWQIGRGLEAGAITDDSFTMPSSEVKVKAIFERVYNITLQTNEHGTVSATVGGKTATTAAANAEVALIATPYEGYKFKEWKVVSGDVEVKDNKFTMPAKNVTIQAVFVKTFKVTFDLNGVTGTAPEAQTVEKGGKVTRPDDPSFEGHSIEGWYTTKDATTGVLSGKWDFYNDTVTANMTLYVQWQTTISTILEMTDSIPTYEAFVPDEYDDWYEIPEGAWVTKEGNKAFKSLPKQPYNAIFNLGCYTDTAYYLSLDDTEPFLLCGDTYVWADDFFGTMTCYMTDGVFTSLTFAGNNQKSAGDIDFSSLNGTYSAPIVLADLMKLQEGFPASYDESSWINEISAAYKIFYKEGSLNVSTSIDGSTVSMAVSDNTLTKNTKGYEYAAEDSHKVIFVMDETKISSIEIWDYSQTEYNGSYTEPACIAAGTMISMPGGKQKTVEELEIGDIICTFDHETGEVSSAPVCFIWESKNVGNAFTLTFEDDTEVTVIEEHGFYDQEEQKYVFINLQNAEEYIGDHFYHADSNNWLELKSCKVSNERVDAYAIITSGDLNHMSNGMLSMCDGTVKMIANTFEYDDRMRYDADKKKADIETYGLTPIEKILEFDGFIEADYVDYSLQYLNVAVGKGLTTWERIKALSDYCVANGLVCIEQTNDVPMLGTEEMEPIIIALDPRSKPESCEPEKLEEAMPEELIEPAEAVAEEAAP